MSHSVFISFSSKDLKLAEKIYNRLGKNGVSCWISSKNIPAGADYQACIVEAINQATIVVLIFSTHANSSNEIAKELSLASKKILIPTRIEDVLPQGAFQYQLSNRQFIDLFDDFDNRLDELADRIKVALDPGSASPVTPRKKSVNWNKLGMQLAVVAGLGGVGIGGIFAASGYFNTKNTASGQVASLTLPAVTTVNAPAHTISSTNSPETSPPVVTVAPSTSIAASEASLNKKSVDFPDDVAIKNELPQTPAESSPTTSARQPMKSIRTGTATTANSLDTKKVVVPASFRLTKKSVIVEADLSDACRSEFGDSFKVADWNDVRAQYQAGVPPDNILTTGSALVSKDGEMYFRNRRHYLVTRANHKRAPGYLAHDSIDNAMFDLGSWHTPLFILCINKS